MGLFDSVKKVKIGEITKKAAELADKHEDKIDQGIDKAARFVDDKTGRKHHDKVDGGAAKLKDAVGKLGDKHEDKGQGQAGH